MDNLTDDTAATNQVGELEKSEAENERQSGTELQRTLSTCFRVLAAAQRNAIFRVMSGKDEETIIKLAKIEIERFAPFSSEGKCKPPRVFNEITGRCELP